MNILKQWVHAERGRGMALARHLAVPPSFVIKMGNGDKPVPVAHGAAIERFTGGVVTRKAMFPEDWHRIWPELAEPATTVNQQPAGQKVTHG